MTIATEGSPASQNELPDEDQIGDTTRDLFITMIAAIQAGSFTGNYEPAFQALRAIAEPTRRKLGIEIRNSDPGEFECIRLLQSGRERSEVIGGFFLTDNAAKQRHAALGNNPELLDAFYQGHAIGTTLAFNIIRVAATDSKVLTATTQALELLEGRSSGGIEAAKKSKVREENLHQKIAKIVKLHGDHLTLTEVAEILRSEYGYTQKPKTLANHVSNWRANNLDS